MNRKISHFEGREPFFEKKLRSLRIRKVTRYIPRESNILDLGCGFSGNFLRQIEYNIKSGIGVDISVNKEIVNKKISLIEHDLNNPLPFPDDVFDIVTSLANLEHLENPEKCIREIYRVLKSGGKLLLTAPSTRAKPVLEFLALIGLVSKQEIADHKNYFGKYSLTRLCEKTGFKKIRHYYFQLGMNNFLTAEK